MIDIRKYIIDDLLKSKMYFNSIDEIILNLNIQEVPKIEIKTYQNQHYNEVIDYFYLIEYTQYKFEFFKNEFWETYPLISIELEINKDNYLHLFPYYTMEEYIESEDFDKINNIKDNIIAYMIDTEAQNEYCYLVFSNDGLLKTLRIVYYFT
jgi:hypothetical protein